MITAENLTSHEFIGLHTEIIHSTNPQVIGLSGLVINETKSMLTINTDNGAKSIAKSICDWQFHVNGNKVIVHGSQIIKRPFDRLS